MCNVSKERGVANDLIVVKNILELLKSVMKRTIYMRKN